MTHLILNFNEVNFDYQELHRHFKIAEEKIITSGEWLTQITILIEIRTYDKVIDFMDKITQEFQKTL